MKHGIDDLALCGGSPTFGQTKHVGSPNLGDTERFLERLRETLDGGRLTNRGPWVRELERRIAEGAGVRHCIATCNATTALQITAQALDLSGEVIVPALTFVATAHALSWQRLTPVFCDVDPVSHNLDPQAVERLVTPQTTAIVGVHLWGRACDIDGLTAVARRHGLRLLFDAAHALGASYRGRSIGGFGDAEVFSLHATKVVNAFEGGAITTDDDRLAERLRLMCNFGFAGRDRVTELGINGKMCEAAAAMGLTSLESLAYYVETNRRHHSRYEAGLAGIPGVSLVRYDGWESCNYHYVVLEIDEGAAGVSRDELLRVLEAEGVLARRYFYPGCHRMEPYRSRQPDGPSLPNTERLVERLLQLPTGTAVCEQDVQAICEILRLAVANGGELRRRLRQADRAASRSFTGVARER